MVMNPNYGSLLCRDCGGPGFMLDGVPKGVMLTYRRHPLPTTCEAWVGMDERDRILAVRQYRNYLQNETT